MCGRFTLSTPAAALAEAFGGSPSDYPAPRYNVAPSQPVVALRQAQAGARGEVVLLRWGLVPSWAESPQIGYRMINARSETVVGKPAFARSFRSRRCLVLADGFYEWQRGRGRRQPYYITLADGRPFAFAGLWDRWTGAAGAVESCTILTTKANEIVGPIHDRMPVILETRAHALWLDASAADVAAVKGLLRPYPEERMAAYAVTTYVNDPRHDDPNCLERLAG